MENLSEFYLTSLDRIPADLTQDGLTSSIFALALLRPCVSLLGSTSPSLPSVSALAAIPAVTTILDSSDSFGCSDSSGFCVTGSFSTSALWVITVPLRHLSRLFRQFLAVSVVPTVLDST